MRLAQRRGNPHAAQAILVVLIAGSGLTLGCARHQERPMITAVGLSPANQCDPPGIPYYLPKPLLVISKNVRHIDESKVGLTGPVPIPGGFDNQAAYGDLKANVAIPPGPNAAGTDAQGKTAADVAGAALSNATQANQFTPSMVAEDLTPDANANFEGGVELDSFFTYQVIFVPDLSQKYGLQITGGAGEFRAAMNMVNGWMYTGMGPFYMKDSSSAQNAMATGVGAMYAGRGVADVVTSVGDLATSFTGKGKENTLSDEDVLRLSAQVKTIEALASVTPKVPQEMLNFAEVYIYEPYLLPDDTTDWRLIAEHHFNRHYLATVDSEEAAEARQQIFDTLLNSATSGIRQPAVNRDSRVSTAVKSPADGGVDESAKAKESTETDWGTEALKEKSPPGYSPPGGYSSQLPAPVSHGTPSPVQINIDTEPAPERSGKIHDFFQRLHQNPTMKTEVGDRSVTSQLNPPN